MSSLTDVLQIIDALRMKFEQRDADMSCAKHFPHNLKRCFLLLILAAMVAPANAAVTINEFLTSNGGGLRDEDLESPDWIEIYNSGPGAVNLAGWRLTD